MKPFRDGHTAVVVIAFGLRRINSEGCFPGIQECHYAYGELHGFVVIRACKEIWATRDIFCRQLIILSIELTKFHVSACKVPCYELRLSDDYRKTES